MLFLQTEVRPCSFALTRAGKSNAARTATMAITTISSIRLKPTRQSASGRSTPRGTLLNCARLTVFIVGCFSWKNYPPKPVLPQACVSLPRPQPDGAATAKARLKWVEPVSDLARLLDLHHFLVLHGFDVAIGESNVNPPVMGYEVASNGRTAGVETDVAHRRRIFVHQQNLLRWRNDFCRSNSARPGLLSPAQALICIQPVVHA